VGDNLVTTNFVRPECIKRKYTLYNPDKPSIVSISVGSDIELISAYKLAILALLGYRYPVSPSGSEAAKLKI
jgi:hypothetical protein